MLFAVGYVTKEYMAEDTWRRQICMAAVEAKAVAQAVHRRASCCAVVRVPVASGGQAVPA